MLSEKEITHISKYLSLILRHKPETIGIVLDANGWTDVATLLDKINENGIPLTIEVLQHIVDTNSKKRFAFNDTLKKIRANQGHSVTVELGHEQQIPPTILYHGTALGFTEMILTTGLQKMQRHHVHLSKDIDTAIAVGQRHGKPVVLEVTSKAMHNDGFIFFISENGVWMTDNVPVKYLTLSK